MNIKEELFKEKFKNDEVYQRISKEYVTLDKNKIIINNKVLSIILAEVIPAMAKSDNMFRKMSRGCMYGGSYYKRLKVSEPDEYDINLIMKLPINYRHLQKITCNCNYPGYIKIKVTDKSHLNYERDSEIWSALLDVDLYLDQNKFRNWMQSVLVNALNRYTENGSVINLDGDWFSINYRQSNPAFTLLIRRDDDGDVFDVDLVPSLLFHDKELPGFIPHKTNTWIAIAKPLQSEVIRIPNLLWRVGFYKDEKEMVKGNIKSIIRIMKMLKRFKEMLRSGEILNFWHINHNLLEKINKVRLHNITNQLEHIINNIENNIETNLLVIQYFTSDE